MKHVDRWRKMALVLWGVCCLVPGVLIALSRSPSAAPRVEKLSELYGREVGAYLGYCPSALLAYLLSLLTLSPVMLLLAALGGEQSARRAPRDALRLAAAWGALNACGLLLLTLVLAITQGRAGAVSGWGLRLWLPLFCSGLPSLGLSVLIAAWFRSRRAAFTVGLLTAGLLGFVGIYARTVGVLWLPGALDQSLFSGNSANGWRAAVFACAWFAFWLVLANLLEQFRQRRTRTPVTG